MFSAFLFLRCKIIVAATSPPRKTPLRLQTAMPPLGNLPSKLDVCLNRHPARAPPVVCYCCYG